MSTEEETFKCTTCRKTFENKHKLKRHEYYAHPKHLLTCPTCGKQFKLKATLQRHILIHTGEQPFACSTCNKRFNQKHRLTEHERIHSGEKPYLCPTCAQRFAYRQTFVEHLRDHAGIKHDCPVCQQDFLYLKHLSRHLNTHADKKHFSCSVCTKEFSELSAFLNHMKDHSGDKQYKCQICNKQFKTINVLQKHINDCLKINQVQSQLTDLRVQLFYVATAKPTKCKYRTCDKEFLDKDEFDEHVKNHKKEKALNRLNANKKRFIGKKFLVCDICELMCPGKYKMIVHLRSHSSARPFKCSGCCEKFKSKGNLKAHKRVVHGVKLPPKRSYIFHEGRHLLVYNGKKPIPLESTKHKCHTCNKEFIKRDKFDEHVKNHVKEKTLNCLKTNQERFMGKICLICDTCDLRCASKSKMEKHLRLHSGVRALKCSIYCQGFSSKSIVKKHKDKLNGVEHPPKSKIKFHEAEDQSFSLEKSAPVERRSYPLEREPSSLENESPPSEKESSPSKIISFAISPELETPESEQGLNKYDHLINKLRKKDLNIVPHKVTISTEKHTPKEDKGHIHQNDHTYEQDKTSLSEGKSFFVARESSPIGKELSSLELITISPKREIPESEQNLKKYKLSMELKLVLHKLNREEIEKHTSKGQTQNVHLHEKENLSLSKRNSFSVEGLEKRSLPFETEPVAPEKNIPESDKDLNKCDHLSNKLDSKVPHKPSKDNENIIFGHQNVQIDEQESISLPESKSFSLAGSAPLERESCPFEIKSFPFEIESLPFEGECSQVDRECSPFERESPPLKSESFPLERKSSPLERKSSPLERESSPLERVSSPLNEISIAIPPERKIPESIKDKYDHLINKLRRKDLNIVPYKLTKVEREKCSLKEHNGYIHQNVHIHEQERTSLSENKIFSVERESTPLESISLSTEREALISDHDLKNYDFSKELKLVLHKLTKNEIEKHTSKEQKEHRKRHQKVLLHEQEKISLPERRSFSVERESHLHQKASYFYQKLNQFLQKERLLNPKKT